MLLPLAQKLLLFKPMANTRYFPKKEFFKALIYSYDFWEYKFVQLQVNKIRLKFENIEVTKGCHSLYMA